MASLRLRFKPVFADPKIHPYQQIDWEAYGAVRALALRGLIDRVVGKYLATGWSEGYFFRAKDREVFRREVTWLLLHQYLALDINTWLTVGGDGKQSVAALVGDFVLLGNTECPRASLDITRFRDDERFDFDKFIAAVELSVTLLDISISFGDFSTEHIGNQARRLRPLGLVLGNLEALLVEFGLMSDTETGRALASALASLASAAAYRRSAELALALPAVRHNQAAVIQKHHQISLQLTDLIVDRLQPPINLEEIIFAANLEWGRALELGTRHGWRNCQLFLTAPSSSFIYDQK